MTAAKKIDGLLGRAAAMEACLLELNISHIAPHKFYGPAPVQHAWGKGGRASQRTDFRVEHKGYPSFEWNHFDGKNWR